MTLSVYCFYDNCIAKYQLYQLKTDMPSMWNSTIYVRGTFSLLIVVLCINVSLAETISDLDGSKYMKKDIRKNYLENLIFQLKFLDNIPIQEILKAEDSMYADGGELGLNQDGMNMVEAKKRMRKRQETNHFPRIGKRLADDNGDLTNNKLAYSVRNPRSIYKMAMDLMALRG